MKTISRKFSFSLIIAVLTMGFNLSAQNQSVADSLMLINNELEEGSLSSMDVLTRIAENQNDPQLRLKYSEQLMALAREKNDCKYLHHAYLQQGQAYRIMGDFEIAIYALFKALDFAEKCEFHKGISGSNTALADVYSLIGNNSNAVDYYERSITYLREADSSLLANTLLNLGDEYYMSKIYDKALACFEESKSIYNQLGTAHIGFAYNLGNIGLVHAALDDLEAAETNILESLRLLGEKEDHYGRSIFLSYLSGIFERKGLLVKAKLLADSSMAIATKYDLKFDVKDNSLRLADIYAMNADFETAYMFHQKYVKLKDSIANEDIYTRIENLKSAFDLAKKQSEVDLLIADKRNQEVIIFSTILVAVILTILAIVTFGYYRSKSRTNAILEEQKAALEALNKTKDKYFSIISHDLRGSVSSFFGISRMIKQLVATRDMKELLEVADDIDQSVERLSNLLDNLLNWAMQQQGQVPINIESHNLLEVIEDIIFTLAYLAKGKRITVNIDIAKDLFIHADKNTANTVFRNLIGNSLKFTPEGGEVIIKGIAHQDKVEILVIDSGVGIDQEKLNQLFDSPKSTYGTSGERGLGIGLQLVKEFVGLNDGSVSVQSEFGSGTTFKVELPGAARP